MYEVYLIIVMAYNLKIGNCTWICIGHAVPTRQVK